LLDILIVKTIKASYAVDFFTENRINA